MTALFSQSATARQTETTLISAQVGASGLRADTGSHCGNATCSASQPSTRKGSISASTATGGKEGRVDYKLGLRNNEAPANAETSRMKLEMHLRSAMHLTQTHTAAVHALSKREND